MNSAPGTVIIVVDAAADLVGASQQHAADQYEFGIGFDLEAQGLAEP
jgi:hypothetical protein